MKFNSYTLGLAASASMLISASAQSTASGLLGGTSGVPNVPSILATATQTNLPASAGNSIDLRANQNLCVGLSFNGSSAATNAAVTATFGPSFDGVNIADSTKTFSLSVTGTGVTTARGSTNVATFAYPYYVPISITNAIGVTVSNIVLVYSTKNGS